jgi:N-acetylneuraminic acid mutarotase
VVAVGGRLLLVGGRTTPDQVSDRLWWWRPPARSWTPAGRLPYPVADAAVLADGSYLYLMGGETPAFTDRVTRVGWR